MTVQEAIKILNPETSADALSEIEYYGGFSGNMAQIQAIIDASLVAIGCMEKQIPKKPIEDNTSYSGYKCPACNSNIYQLRSHNIMQTPHCIFCGQALKWGEEDEP